MMSKEKGFSLIEILVGSVIVIGATTAVLSIIISSLRISTKTTANAEIRQNGNYALSQASRLLQFADSFEGVSSTFTTNPTTTICPTTEMSYNYIYFYYNNVRRYISCGTNGLLIDGNTSIDMNKFRSNSCTLTCSQQPDEGPIIGIDFELSSSSVSTPEQKVGINFSTSVKMRNQ